MLRERDWADEPVVLTVAPTGAEVTRANHPGVPYSPEEIAEAAVTAGAEGATVVHIHVREPDGRPSGRTELFQDVIERIRARTDMVTMISTGGAAGMAIAERMSGLGAGPDMASIEVGSLNFGEDLFATLPRETRDIARMARNVGAALEVEIFDLGHVDAAARFLADGTLTGPLRCNLVLGVPGGVAASAINLISLVAALPSEARWGVTAVGRAQWRMLALGATLGASVLRVGFEDALRLATGQLAASNAELVAATRALVAGIGRRIATVEETRAILEVVRRT